MTRLGALPVAADEGLVTDQAGFGRLPGPRRPDPIELHRIGEGIDKDWSQALGKSAKAQLVIDIATPGSSSISGSSILTVDGTAFDASAPTGSTGVLTMGTAPTSGTLIVGGITYTFSGTTLGTTPAANNCNVYGTGTHTTTEDNLVGAMTNGASGSAKGTTAWECNSDVPTDSTVTVSSFNTTNHTITLESTTLGSSSPAITTPSGTDVSNGDLTWAGGGTNGTNGTPSTTAFTYWTGTTYVSAAQLATNIAAAVNSNGVGVTAVANYPASGDVTFIDKTAGTAGNSFTESVTSFSAVTPSSGTFSGGTAAAAVQPNAYPAKYGASLTGASCANDYVVYPTGQPGAPSAANIIAYNNIYTGTAGDLCGGAGVAPTVYWAYNTATNGDWVSTSPIISWDGTQVAYIQSNGTSASLVVLKWAAAITANASCTNNCSLTSGSATITAGASFFTQAMVGDTITGTDIPTGTYLLSIASGTSATLSNAATGTVASETVTVDAPTLTAPASLQAVPTTSYLACTAPCMTIVPFGDAHDDTYSSPFYDYSYGTTAFQDELFVGDDLGSLHEFTPVFYGAPAEAGSGWPFSLVSGTALGSPTYDPGSGYIFAGSMAGTLYSVGSGNVGTTAASVHGTTGVIADALLDAPLVDSVAGTVYVFANESEKTGVYVGYNTMFQFLTGFTTYTNPQGPGVVALWRTADVGANGATGHYLYSGSFDNVYYQNTTATGSLYVVADSGLTIGATLYRVPINNGSLGTVAAAVTGLTTNATGAYPWPSALTEFCNGTCGITSTGCAGGAATCTASGSNDFVFFSVNQGNHATYANCTNGAGNGCIFSFNVTSPTAISVAGEQNYTNVTGNGCWATSGMVIDNDASATGGGSQIYYFGMNGTTAGGPNGATSSACAAGAGTTINGIQASQAAP